MHKKVLVMALAGLVPVLAWASTPLQVRFEGHMVPVRETVQVAHTPEGTVRVRTWTWRGPGGTAAFQVSESRGPRSALPAAALAQMRRLQMQVNRMRQIEAGLEQPLMALAPPIPVVWSGPMVVPLPGLALPLQTRILQPVLVRRVLLPARVIEIVPVPPIPRAQPPAAAPVPGPGLGHRPGVRV
jgi:hypothetical protein